QFSAGFSLMAAYTFGRNIDISGDEQSGVTVDPRNLDLDRGLSESQVKNRLTVSYIWELPFGPGKPFLNHGKVLGGFVGGWQLSGVTLFQSGNALTVTATGDSANVGLGTRPVRVCDGALDDSSIREWFNTACFVAPAFTYGNSGRGVIIGPGKQTWDVGVAKRFRVTERHFVQFRAEYFNTFNHPNLGTPGLTLGTPAFGTITSADQARTAQLALKS